jgi:hypothetical protein
MTYEFVMLKDRIPVLVKELGDKITIGEDHKNDLVSVKIKIKQGSDLLRVFHAGLFYGMGAMSKVKK